MHTKPINYILVTLFTKVHSTLFDTKVQQHLYNNKNIFQIMKGGKGSGIRRRNPENMTIRRFIEKSIDAMAFLFTASFAAIAVVATIVIIGCIL